MYCVKCGTKIEDGYKFCPECGAKVVSVENTATQQEEPSKEDELERIADEIFWRGPGDVVGTAKILSRDTGMPFKEAKQMMYKKYKEWKRGKKTGKYPDWKYCPICASQDLEDFQKPGMIISRQSSAFSGVLISSQADNIDMKRCRRCGFKYMPDKKR